MKNKKTLLALVVVFIFALIAYFFMLPPINLTSPLFWFYLGINILLFVFLVSVPTPNTIVNLIKKDKLSKTPMYIIFGFVAIIFVIIVINFIASPLFNSKSYHKRINVLETTNFINDVKPVDFDKLPLLDKESSQKLGDRVMGQMPELVSQFLVSDLYTQINFNDKIVRVTPLEYNGIFKYLSNHKDGVKGYIMVNSVSGEATLKKLDDGMKYMPSSYLMKNLYRHLRYQYPTFIFGDESFEIDNEGNPYWIVPTIKYTGVGLKREVSGIVILNPVTGESKHYNTSDVPTWVDHVYSADLIIEQVDDWGRYKNGYFNSIFGQKGVVETTDGYNYTVINDDVYLYTGITSAASDQSNIGFILTNMRTKETHFYAVPGAEEFSAMASAEGQVQQMKYKASFPLLTNLNNKATYVISLKDNAGLVKMYAFVDVADYQKVVVTDASKGIMEAANNYLKGSDINSSESFKKKTITVQSITSALIDGNSYYYIMDANLSKYRISINVDKLNIPFITANQTLEIEYIKDDKVTEILKLKIV